MGISSHKVQRLQKSRIISASPIFYGWVILIVAVVGMTMTSPGQAYIFSIFAAGVTKDLQISRSLVSTLYTIGSLIGSAALPLIGRSIDRFGSRGMVTVIALLYGLACIYMGYIENALMLGLGFALLRILGPGGLALISENIINQWWHERRGTIVGLSSMLFAIIGVAFVPNLVNWINTQAGWRSTFQILGLSLLCIMVPVGYLFFRDRPELYGLWPDGHPPMKRSISVNGQESEETEINWTLFQALRAPAFWIVSLGVGTLAMIITGVLFHQVEIFNDHGLSASAATATFIPISLAMAVFSISGGMLLDRIPARGVLGGALIILSCALFLGTQVADPISIIAFGLMLGSATGLMRTLSGSVWAMYFGRLHLGSISGVARGIIIAGAALGPMPFGISRDLTGSFNPALITTGFLALGLGIAAFLIREPGK